MHDYTWVNRRSAIDARIHRCRTDLGRLPNFVALDFVDRGEGLGVGHRTGRVDHDRPLAPRPASVT